MLEPRFQFSNRKMGRTISPETSVSKYTKTPGNYPKEDKLHTSNHSESLNFNNSSVSYPVSGVARLEEAQGTVVVARISGEEIITADYSVQYQK